MIKTKNKWISILVLLVILLLCGSLNLFNEAKHTKSPNLESVGELTGKRLGGVVCKIPDNSAKILFENLLGVKLSAYQAFDTVAETVAAVKSNEVDVAWFPDVTVQYLLSTVDGLHEIKGPKLIEESRLEFALALNKKDTALQEEFNRALQELKQEGTLDSLISTYVTAKDYSSTFLPKNMQIKNEKSSLATKGKIYIGVTGATPPIDMLTPSGQPTGFSVALMDALGAKMGRDIEFVVIKNEAIFTSLIAGKVDALFCYGTSKSTIQGVKDYIMTDGYYTMDNYSYIVLD